MNRVELVGILNVTPDSFSDGGLFNSDTAVARTEELFQQGASYVDIGAESTRPGATPLSAEEEWLRLKDFLPEVIFGYRGQISVDTYHPETVRRLAKNCGNFILNDVTGFNNPEMLVTAAELGLQCIVSHLPPRVGQNIQGAHQADHKINSIDRVADELLRKRQEMIFAGVRANHIILDPGIGFGKSLLLNRRLLRFAEYVSGIDVMIGHSKKSFLGEGRMEKDVNIKAARIAIEAGTRYLRVHDPLWYRQLVNG